MTGLLAVVLASSLALGNSEFDRSAAEGAARIAVKSIKERILKSTAWSKDLKEAILADPAKAAKRADAEKLCREIFLKASAEELKREVIFRQFNLMNPFPFRRKFHVVFLRNVMIYFEDDTKYQLIEKIYNYMESGGYLFIGTTESLDRTKIKFQYVEPSIYKKI
jgi:chemotaxis protein methyltransferase CheR